jgi:hypothetical protein
MWLAISTYGYLVSVVVGALADHLRGAGFSDGSEHPVQHLFCFGKLSVDILKHFPSETDVPISRHL